MSNHDSSDTFNNDFNSDFNNVSANPFNKTSTPMSSQSQEVLRLEALKSLIISVNLMRLRCCTVLT